MRLCLVTVNYNNAASTLELLSDLDRQTDQEFDCVVVDNNSEQSDRVQLKPFEEKNWCSLLWSSSNDGFAAGCNLGIERGLKRGADYILLINNDTRVAANFIEELKKAVTGEGITAVPLQEGTIVAYAGEVSWLKQTLSHIYAPIYEDHTKLYAIGGGALIHRNVFEKIGGLDERYFLYFEDADFSMQARKAGVPFSFITAPIIEHKVSETTRKLGSPLLLRYHYRNMFLFNQRFAPWYIKITLPAWAFLGIVKQMLKLVLRPSERPQSKAIFGGILDYVTGRFGKISF